MQVVVTVHTYWPNRDGVQYVTEYLCEGLAAKGHRVTVVTTVSDQDLVGEEVNNGVRIVRTFLKTKYSFVHFGTKSYRNTFMREACNADCIVNCCVQAPNNNVLLPLLKKVSGFKLLYMHGMHEFQLPKNASFDLKYRLWHAFMNVRWRVFYKANKNNFNEYDSIVDIHESSQGIGFMKKLGVKANTHIITNAVEDFSEVIISEKDKKDYPVLGEMFFLDVANFNDRKNQCMLIEAFHAVQDRRGSKLVLIGGSSDYSASLKEKVKQIGLNNDVLIYENLDREITRKFIKSCACGVLSSRFEVYPIFLCEVISCGHPFVSTDVGCVRDIPGGDIVNSTDELAHALQRMIDDKDHRTELGAVGKQFADDNLSQQCKIDQFERILLEGIGK